MSDDHQIWNQSVDGDWLRNSGLLSDGNFNASRSVGEAEAVESYSEQLEDPIVAAAIVEFVEREVVSKVNSECPSQDDREKLAASWKKWLEHGAEQCSIEITPGQLARLWNGCLRAAKALSPVNYWQGPLSPDVRYHLFKSIFESSREDVIERLGMLAAPAFKAFRKEAITLEGVPLRTCGDPGFLAWEGLGIKQRYGDPVREGVNHYAWKDPHEIKW